MNSATAAKLLATNLLKQSRFSEAERLIRAALSTRQRETPNDWTTFSTQSLLGASLLGQQKYEEAEQLLLSGHSGMEERASTIPAAGVDFLKDSIQRVVDLYDAAEKPDQAAKWRERLPLTSGAQGLEPGK